MRASAPLRRVATSLVSHWPCSSKPSEPWRSVARSAAACVASVPVAISASTRRLSIARTPVATSKSSIRGSAAGADDSAGASDARAVTVSVDCAWLRPAATSMIIPQILLDRTITRAARLHLADHAQRGAQGRAPKRQRDSPSRALAMIEADAVDAAHGAADVRADAPGQTGVVGDQHLAVIAAGVTDLVAVQVDRV